MQDVREAGRGDVAALVGLMRGFYAESGFVLVEGHAAAQAVYRQAGFEPLAGHAVTQLALAPPSRETRRPARVGRRRG